MSTEILRFGQHLFDVVGFSIAFVLVAAFPTQRAERVASFTQICKLHLPSLCTGKTWCLRQGEHLDFPRERERN